MKKLFLLCSVISSFIGIQAQNMTSGDSHFITNALQNSTQQVKLAELTITHSSSADVKRLGQQIIKDHIKLTRN